MFNFLQKLFTPFLYHKYLLSQLITREIKGRYKQSIVGYAWIIINPLSQLLVYSFVFSVITRFPTGSIPYPIFLFTGLVPWIYLQTSMTVSTACLVDNSNLIRKVYFPREILPYSVILSKFVDFFFASLLLIPFMIYYGISFQPTLFFLIPTIIIQMVLMTGLSLFFSAFNLFYRDVQYLISLILLLWLYLTPVLYPAFMVPKNLTWVYYLNPMAGIIEGYRYAYFGTDFYPQYFLSSLILSIVIFSSGFIFFRNVEGYFADIA